MIFAAPDEFQMKEDILQFLDAHNISYTKVDSIIEAIDEADAIYMTRIQDEWNEVKTEGHPPTHENVIFRREFLDRMKPTACLMHPLPKRDEIDIEVDYANDPRVVYWRQERNGMWMRVAIIAKLFGCDEKIFNF